MRSPQLKKFPTGVAVAAAALIDGQGRVLMQQRRLDSRHGGLWEFPGGKLEAGESGESALVREIAEELGIALDPAALALAAVSHDPDPDPATRDPHVLFLYTSRRWRGEPRCLDGDAIGWFDAAEAARLPVPPLDVPLVAELPKILARWGIAKPGPRTYVRPSRARSSAG